MEVTFEEERAHLGVETQRQWSDPAIARTTPVLLGLFSLITLWAHDLAPNPLPTAAPAPSYQKPLPTFSDAIAAIRRELWVSANLRTSAPSQDFLKISSSTLNALINLA